MGKYLTRNEAINYLMEENVGEVLICKMLEEFYPDPYWIASEQDIKQWLEKQ